MGFWAHTPNKPGGEPHDLETHLRDVAERTKLYAEKFDSGAAGYLVGLAHDVAKCAPAFQAYLRASQEGKQKEKCPHAMPSAMALGPELAPLWNVVAGHHRGLYDTNQVGQEASKATAGTVQAASQLWTNLAATVPTFETPTELIEDPLRFELWTRMLFSALIDADRLDTEQFATGRDRKDEAEYSPLSWYAEHLTARLNGFAPEPTTLSRVRNEVRHACETAAPFPPGFFRLTVPTGGGKTLSGLAFALNHAVQHNLDRVIFAIPYTSIIEQTAQVYRDIFGEENVIEHHSNVGAESETEDSDPLEERRKWATENWDAPLVVTTTVQLFESLLSHKPRRCRKLHNIARSVIVLDEVQTLPAHCLVPILDVLTQLTQHYGCTVVLCTATQPDYSTVDARIGTGAREIIPQYAEHFEALKRVEFTFEAEPWEVPEAAQRLAAEPQALMVVNTKRMARELAQALEGTEGLFHLSTSMCADHRRKKLAEVKERLKEGEPVRLVSTQLIEAGVDVDFPVVFRALGPLDSLIQAAGRCNREGLLPMGRCVVFSPTEDIKPGGAYNTATQATRDLCLKEGGAPDDPRVSMEFWRRLFQSTSVGEKGVQTLRAQCKFQQVGETFKMIDDDQTGVIPMEYAPADIEYWLGDWHAAVARRWYRRSQQWTVNLRGREFAKARSLNLIEQHDSGLWLYTGDYNSTFGIQLDAPEAEAMVR